jgi:hypothetical protein
VSTGIIRSYGEYPIGHGDAMGPVGRPPEVRCGESTK